MVRFCSFLALCVLLTAAAMMFGLACQNTINLVIELMDPGATTHWVSGRTSDDTTLPACLAFFHFANLAVFAVRFLEEMRIDFLGCDDKSAEGRTVVAVLGVLGIGLALSLRAIWPNLPLLKTSGVLALAFLIVWAVESIVSRGHALGSFGRFARRKTFLFCACLVAGAPAAGLVLGGLLFLFCQQVEGSFLFGLCVGASWPLAVAPTLTDRRGW